MQQYKLSKLSNDSTISKFVTNKWVNVNDLSVVNILSTKVSGLKLQC